MRDVSPETAPYPLVLLLMPWGRVGSNMINTILTSLGAKVHNERLTGIETELTPAGREAVAAAQMAWLQDQLAPNRLAAPTVLNHAALSTADPDAMRAWIDQRQPRLITLDRGDDVAVALSSARAAAWVAEGKTIGEARNWSIRSKVAFRPHIAPEDLRRRLDLLRKGRAIMQGLIAGKPTLRLYYEDLVADLDGAMVAILRHAGIPWAPFTIPSARFGSDHLADMVANPDDLAPILQAADTPTAILF